MGKSKGGGSSGGADIQGIEYALQQQSNQFGGLGGYESQFLGEPYNIGNYYMNLATGGGGPQAVGSQTPFGSSGGFEGQNIMNYGSGGGSGGGGLPGTSNPWVTGLENSLSTEESSIPGMQSFSNTLQQDAGTEMGYANSLRNQLNKNGGLFKDQQAEIQAQVNSGQNQVRQQLSSEGLGSSSMGAELGSEIGLQGAATGGQLIQGNIGAVNQADQIANLANGTALQGQGQLFSELTNIGQQNLTAQSTFFQQAMTGYGGAGAALNNVLGPYGYQTADYTDMGSLAEQNASIQAGIANAGTAAQGAGMQGLFSGLGSLLGGSGGGLGGLLGSAGSAGSLGLMGADGTIGATSLAGAGSGILGGLGSGIGAIGSAISAIFASSCTAGRGIAGVTDIRWVLFRDWILYRAPGLIRLLYVTHADAVNRALCHFWVREPFLFLVDQVVTHDQSTRTA